MIKPKKGLILHNLAVKRGGRGPDRPMPGSANDSATPSSGSGRYSKSSSRKVMLLKGTAPLTVPML